MPKSFTFQNLETRSECTASKMAAVWEASLDPMSDDYTPNEISASDLFAKWARRVTEEYQNGMIPLHWFVEVNGPNIKTFERIPSQFDHFAGKFVSRRDFLDIFSWPVDMETGEALNWMTLSVVDKLWRKGQADKGGFIQGHRLDAFGPSAICLSIFVTSSGSAICSREVGEEHDHT